MNRKALLVSIPLALSLGLCGCNAEVKTSDEGNAAQEETKVEEEVVEEEEPEPQPEPEEEEPQYSEMAVGDRIQTTKFAVSLTAAYSSNILESSESRTYWEASDGGAFVILEFDVTALTSDKLPVDGYALADMTANYNGNTYQNWEMKYVTGELWLPFTNTYLEANLPCHVYAYTTVPADVLNGGSVTVDMSISGIPYEIAVQ